jgi:hypothetical protein
MAVKNGTKWVKPARERYAEALQDLATSRDAWASDPVLRPGMAVADWGMRYQARRAAFELIRTPDPATYEALVARHLAADAAEPGRLEWPDRELGYTVSGSNTSRFAGVDRDEPHPYGPSLRMLWLRAEGEGRDLEGIWEALERWAHSPLPPTRKAPAAKWRKQEIEWEPGPDGSWHASGLALRLNDFPDHAAWTLLVDGEEIGDLEAWPDAWHRGPRVVKAPIVLGEAAKRWVSRYRAGEREAVWHEIAEAGPEGRTKEARTVAKETMQRLRHDLDLLVPRLERHGYTFGGRHYDLPTRLLPDLEDVAEVRRWARRKRPMPLSLEAFIAEVGGIDLIGQHPVLNPGGTRDALVVIPPDSSWAAALEMLEIDVGEPPFELLVSLHPEEKEAVALGEDVLLEAGPGIELPDASGDAKLLHFDGYFVPWLRRFLAGGGFSGWGDDAPPDVRALTDGFLGF